MSRNIMMEYPIPAYWQDFEILTCELCKILWKNTNAQRHGRSGQAQGGIDVYGVDNTQNKEKVAVQCKKRQWKMSPSKEAPDNTLTKQEIDHEISELVASTKKIDRYIIAITGPRDVELQNYVAAINNSNKHDFEVYIWFWDDYCEWLSRFPDLDAIYYHDLSKIREEYNQDELFCDMLYKAFDRPAFHTPFCSENNITDFMLAIEHIQQALNTGNLVNRDGHVISQVRIPDKKILPTAFTSLKKQIQNLRIYTTEQLCQGNIVQQNDWLIMMSKDISEHMNYLRKKIISSLNIVFSHYGASILDVETY